MVTEVLEEKSISDLLKTVTHLVKLPKTRMWLDYDSEADVLYLHFEETPGSLIAKCGMTASSLITGAIVW